MRVCVVQLSTIERFHIKQIIEEIDRSVQNNNSLREQIDFIRNEVLQHHDALIESKIVHIVKQLGEHYKPQIIVFPEYSIPFVLLPMLTKLSTQYNCIIYAGSHKVSLQDVKDGAYRNFVPEISQEDAAKNICPVIIPGDSCIYYSEKLYPSHLEKTIYGDMVESVKAGSKLLLCETPFGKIVNLICFDLQGAQQYLGTLFNKNLIDILVLVSSNPKIDEDVKTAAQFVKRRHIYVLLANEAKSGGSNMIANIDRDLAGSSLGKSSENCIFDQYDGECVLVADLNISKKGVTLPHKVDYVSNVSGASLLPIVYDHLTSQNSLSEWLKQLKEVDENEFNKFLKEQTNAEFWRWLNSFNSSQLNEVFRKVSVTLADKGKDDIIRSLDVIALRLEEGILNEDEWKYVSLHKLKAITRLSEIKSEVLNKLILMIDSKISELQNKNAIRSAVKDSPEAFADISERRCHESLGLYASSLWESLNSYRNGLLTKDEIDVMIKEPEVERIMSVTELKAFEKIMISDSMDKHGREYNLLEGIRLLKLAIKEYRMKGLVREYLRTSLTLVRELINLFLFVEKNEEKLDVITEAKNVADKLRKSSSLFSPSCGLASMLLGECYKELAMITSDVSKQKAIFHEAESALKEAETCFSHHPIHDMFSQLLATVYRHQAVVSEFFGYWEEDDKKKKAHFEHWRDLSLSAAKTLETKKEYPIAGYGWMNAGSSLIRLTKWESNRTKQRKLLEEALEYCEKAINISDKTLDERGKGFARYHACTCIEAIIEWNLVSKDQSYITSLLTKFSDCSFKAVEHLERTSDLLGLGLAVRVMGKGLLLDAQHKNLDEQNIFLAIKKATNYFERSISLLEKTGYSLGLAKTYFDMAECQNHLATHEKDSDKKQQLLSSAIHYWGEGLIHFAKTKMAKEDELIKMHKVLKDSFGRFVYPP